MNPDISDLDVVLGADSSAWISAGSFSLYVQRVGARLTVSVFPLGAEMETPLKTFTVFQPSR